MDEEVPMDSRQSFPPFYEGKNVPFRAEEVIKILKNVKESDHVNSIPEKPQGGDVYIFKPLSEDTADDWKSDGLRWKSVSSVHLPRNKKPLVWKRTFTLQDGPEGGGGDGGGKKDVYSWEMGEGDKHVCLVHYHGNATDTHATAAKTAGPDSSEVDQSGATAETEEQAQESGQKAGAGDEARETTGEAGNEAGEAGDGQAGSIDGEAGGDGGEKGGELEAAMKAMQAALGNKAQTTPVMDVFNKLMETVVSNKDNADLELCLVVADKKSGESSLTGHEEAKKIVSTPVRRSARKRRASTDEEQTEEEPDEEPDGDWEEEEEDPVRKPAHKKPRVIVSKRPLKKITRTPEENVVTLASGKTERIAVPRKEVFFAPLIVSSEEKRIHAEFFDGSHHSRTQQKYLKLRNHIINNWSQVKPLYLGSNQARKGISKVGDVGVFRRIFKYLECKGVINFDATPKRAQFEDEEETQGENEEEEEEDEPAARSKRTPASKSATKTPAAATPSKSPATPASTPSKRGRGRPPGSTGTSTEPKVKLKTKIKQEPIEPELILSPGRSRRNRATPNWADILGGRATFYKDAGLAREVAEEETSDGESGGRRKGRPRKTADDEEDGEEAEAGSTPRGRGRPRKDASVSKPQQADDDEAATPRPRGRPRKDGGSTGSVVKDKETTSTDGTESAKKGRGRPRKISSLNEDGTEKVSGNSQQSLAGEGSNDEAETGDQVEDMETEEGNPDDEPEAAQDENSSSAWQSGRRLQYKYTCEVCSKGFALKYLLKEHVARHGTSPVKQERPGQDDPDDLDEEYLDDDMDDDYQPEPGDAKSVGVAADIDEGSGDDFPAEPKQKKPKVYSDSYKRALKANRPTCNICGTVFLTTGNLRKHYLLHSNKMYECPYCAKLMKRKDYVVAHIRKCHKDIDLVKDPVDFRKFTHVLTNENLEGLEGLPAGGNDEVEESGEPGEPGEAAEEGAPADSKPRTGLGKSVCPECLNVFDSTAELEQHMIDVHQKVLDESLYKCAACKKEFKSLVSFQVHKLSHRKKEHECAHCGAVFRTNSQLQVHKRHDHNIQYGTLMYFGFLMVKDRITCEICSADFDTMADYHEHRPEHLSLEFLCSVCGNGFMSEQELQKHVESNCVYQNLHLPCGVCDQKFSMYDARRRHVVTNHKKTSDMNCHHCGACFLDLESLRTHFTIHKTERIFECEFCEKRFFEKRNLVDHRELHRDNKSYQCTICERLYISSKSLQRHIKLHLAGGDQRTCQTCDVRYSTNEELMRHMEQQHATVTGRDTNNKDSFDHTCNICGRKFLFKSRLVKHMQIHNDEERKVETYQCPSCNETLETGTMPLWKHMKQAHPEELKKKSWKRERMCEMCGFTTVHKQRLERHMETHNAEKRFQCRYCEKMFQTTSSMLTHMIIHRGKIKKGVKSHSACSWPLCNKSFLKHSNMKRHLISHIFRVKVNKDWCDCKDCDRRNEEFITNQAGEYEYFEDDGSGSFVKVSAEAMMTRGITTGNDDAQMNGMGMNQTAGMEGYESMDVLQEAIAQIEDIEKNAGTGTVVTSEASQTSKTGSAAGMADAGTQLDGTQAAPPPGETLPTVVSNLRVHRNPVKVKQEELIAGQVEDQAAPPTTLDTDLAPGGVLASEVQSELAASQDDMAGLFGQEGAGGVTECIYECGVCDLMFETKCQVLYHLEDEHVDNRFPKCEECGKFYIDKKNLAEHSTIHLGSREFSCDVCNKNFRTKQCLRQHQYIHAEVKPFICTYCGHGFTQRGFFDEHVRRHTGDRPFRCIVCTKGFVSKNLLKLHMYQHTGNKPHKCPSCPKAFAENYQLVAHTRTHNDDRPFQCSECDKAFFVKPKLIRHMNTVHSIEKEFLSSYVPTKVGNGVGYRDRAKMRDERKTQVVYIDGQGNIISQNVTTEGELKRQKARIRNARPHIQRSLRQQPTTSSQQVVVVQPPQATPDTLTESRPGNAFEVVTRRDSSGQIQVNTVNMERQEHVIVENDGMQIEEQQVVMQNSDGSETIVSIPEHGDNIVYQEMEAGEGSIELNGQNYTLVTQADGSGGQESHLQLITQALAGVQGGELDGAGGGEIRVITEEVGQEGLVEGAGEGGVAGADPGSIQIYTEETVEAGGQEGAENISINIGEDGTVDAADFEKIEALRSLYNDQPIVIVLESQQQ